jgi:hypothetical protein
MTIFKLCGFSLQANYTDRPPLVSKYQPLRIEGAVWSARWFPTAVNLDFLNPELLVLPSSSNYPQDAEWTLSQTHSEKIWKIRESDPDLWKCSQKLWSLVHRDNLTEYNTNISYYNNLAVLKTVSVVLNTP